MKKNLLAVAVASLALTTMAQAAFKDMTVDGIAVSKAAQEAVYQQALQQGAQGGAKLEEAITNEFVTKAALVAAARKSGVDKQPQVKQAIDAAVEQVTDDLLERAYINDIATKYQPSQAELKKIYDQMKSQTPDKEYEYSVIAVRTQKEAQDVIAKLNKKADFSKLATEVSVDPTAKNGGKLGYAFQTILQPEIQQAVKNLKAGQYTTKPIEVNGTWVVMKLDGERATQFHPFDAKMQEQLANVARQEYVQNFVADLAKKAQVK